MAQVKNSKAIPSRLNASIRRLFLARLSETSNVAASARFAGCSGSAIYAERRRSASFRSEWAEALSEGYAKLEAALLAEAMQAASAQTSDAMLKSRAQKHRLALALLAAHRVSVKGAAVSAAQQVPAVDGKEIKARLLAKLDQMRARSEAKLTDMENMDANSGRQ